MKASSCALLVLCALACRTTRGVDESRTCPGSCGRVDQAEVARALGGCPPWLVDELQPDERAFLERLEHGERVRATAAVEAYREQSEWWPADDGGTRSWDIAILRVRAPPAYAGAMFDIHLERPVPDPSPWKNVGAIYRITLPRAALEPRDSLTWFGPGLIEEMVLVSGPLPVAR